MTSKHSPEVERAAHAVAKLRKISLQRAREVVQFEQPELVAKYGSTPAHKTPVGKSKSAKSTKSSEPKRPRTRQEIADDVKVQAQERAAKSGRHWVHEFEELITSDPGLVQLHRQAPVEYPDETPTATAATPTLREAVDKALSARYKVLESQGVDPGEAAQRVLSEPLARKAAAVAKMREADQPARAAAEALHEAGVPSADIAAALRYGA